MKKFLVLSLMLCVVMAGVVVADAPRNTTLGSPILNIQDTALLSRYAAGLQMFPNTIYAGFDGVALLTPYAYFGVSYKASDLLGLAVRYESVPSSETVTFDPDALIWGASFTENMNRVASVIYGGKLGTMYFGASAQTYFYSDLNWQMSWVFKDTNSGKVFEYYKFSGFKTTLNPSIILDVGGLNVFAGINSTLNFARYSEGYTNGAQQWQETYFQPAIFEEVELSALLAKDVNDTTTIGAEFKIGIMQNGYTFQDSTNDVPIYKTNSYQGGSMGGSLGLGAKIKATEAVTIFADMYTAVESVTPRHVKGADPTTYVIQTYWQIPSFTLGAEFEVLKNLFVRISAKPEYILRYDTPGGYKGTGNAYANYTDTFVDDFFNVTSSVGLGWYVGAFKINWVLDTALLDTALRNPMQFININGGGPTLASSVQVNFAF